MLASDEELCTTTIRNLLVQVLFRETEVAYITRATRSVVHRAADKGTSGSSGALQLLMDVLSRAKFENLDILPIKRIIFKESVGMRSLLCGPGSPGLSSLIRMWYLPCC